MLKFLQSEVFENEGEAQPGIPMVCSGWLSIPNFSFRGHFNLDSKVTFLSIIIFIDGKILMYHLKLFKILTFSSILVPVNMI